MRAAEFFAGMGLMRAGLESAGVRTVFANDIDRNKAALYRANWGDDALVVDDLECTARVGHGSAQILALLHTCSQRLFHEDVFARGQRLQAERDVELIGRGDDDRFHLRICKHVGKVGVGFLRLVNGRHALD